MLKDECINCWGLLKSCRHSLDFNSRQLLNPVSSGEQSTSFIKLACHTIKITVVSSSAFLERFPFLLATVVVLITWCGCEKSRLVTKALMSFLKAITSGRVNNVQHVIRHYYIMWFIPMDYQLSSPFISLMFQASTLNSKFVSHDK